MTEHLHPGLVLVFAGLIAGGVRGAARTALVLAAALAAVALVWSAPAGVLWRTEFLGYELAPYAVDTLSRLFALIFSLMALGGALFAVHQEDRLELPAAMVYSGSAIGVTLAGDLISVFVFWELMTIGSTLVIWSARTGAARAASFRYLMVHLFGGALLMAGLAGHVAETGSVAFARIGLESASQWLILAGFLVNAAAPPFSAWLPDAYPEASWSGTVFLSAFTTKAAVYVLMRGFPGAEPLIYFGLFMAFYGIVYALLENDIRRILAYSIVSQVGFMVTGVGVGSELALNGVAAHAFAHIAYKALLLMAAGSVLYATGRRRCSEFGGLARAMPLTAGCAVIGAMSISAFPLTSGFVAKSMIVQAAAEAHLAAVWLALVAASAGTALYAGFRFTWLVFFQNGGTPRAADPPLAMRLAMLLFAALCIGIGVFHPALYALLPYAADYEPYTAPHVVAQLQLLLFSGLAFYLALPLLRRSLGITLDMDWWYRRPGPAAARVCAGAISGALGALAAESRRAGAVALRWTLESHGPAAVLARTMSTGTVALWVGVLLAACLLLYYALL